MSEGEKLIDKHIFIPVSQFNGLKKMCLHKGDLSWHINQAILQYLEREEAKRDQPR